MTLTVVVGSSGSGKTTFLGDVHKLNQCCYVRQYHTLRPYIPVNKIPNFDPTRLPFWNLYTEKELVAGQENESFNPNVAIGGTMAGEFHAGLSGGQRKLMIFELVRQRVADQSGLLICLDEPFCGVTDNFVPFIVEGLNEMRKSHNILLVTNDHIDTLTKLGDSTITVSAIDRTKVTVDGKPFDREVSLHAVATGKEFVHTTDSNDLAFFMSTELLTNPQVGAVIGFTIFSMFLFCLSYWDSQGRSGIVPGSEELVMVALQIISYFAINPFLIALPDWRNAMIEEAEALLHTSVQMNLALKSGVVLLLLLAISGIAFGCLNLVIDTLNTTDIWVSMLFDSASLTFPFICFGLYTKLPLQLVQIFASMPFLFMIFFSTTFSPGAGVDAVKELRFLFARFYFWCQMPNVKSQMDSCPADNMLVLYTVLSGSLGLFLFLVVMFIIHQVAKKADNSATTKHAEIAAKPEFLALQAALFKGNPGGLAEVVVDGESRTVTKVAEI